MRCRKLCLALLLLVVYGPAAKATVWYVKADATGGNNGTSWTDAYTDLQSALTTAVNGDEIWVAAGTYKPTPGTDRTVSFALNDGVGLYGGFAGTETARSQRDPTANVTTLSGDIGTPGDSTDNSYTVVSAASNVTSSAVLDGFTVTQGRADGSGHTSGGGFRQFSLTTSFPTISNCIFSNNYAADFGAGVAINSPATVGFGATGTFTKCRFINNLAPNSGIGGGAWLDDIRPTLINCVFQGNVAVYGGGMAADDISAMPLTNCVFQNNSANRGGAISMAGSDISLENGTLSGNSASLGSAIYTEPGNSSIGSGAITLTNSIVWANPPSQGGVIYSNTPYNPFTGNYAPPATLTIQYSDVEAQGFPTSGTDGNGNFGTDPLFIPGTVLLSCLSPCIDTGSNALVTAGITTDLAGNPRFYNAIVDMGAYERQGDRAPVATPDSYTTENTTLTVNAATGVLANDSDPDGDPITAALVTNPTNGMVTLNTDGSFTYTPNANFSGPDSFTYMASDGVLSSAPATVSITVLSPPDAQDDSATLDARTSANINVLANDSDPDGDTLTVQSITQPSNGTSTLNSDNTVTYTPNSDFTGSDGFTYTISDGKGGTATATVHLTVNPLATTISVTNVTATFGQQVTLSATLQQSSNSAPLSGQTLTFQVGGNQVGTASTDGSGRAQITYVPPDSLGTGMQTIAVSFAGASVYNASSGTGTLTLNAGDTFITVLSDAGTQFSGAQGKTITLKGNLKRSSDKTGLLGRTLTFYVDGNQVGTAVTIASGSAWYRTYTIPDSLSIGVHTLTVSFAGDANYNASIGNGTLTVTKGDTTVIVLSDAGTQFSGVPGQKIMLKGKLLRTSDKTPLVGRTLTFSVDGNQVGTAVTGSTGSARLSYPIPELSIGVHTLTVSFAGDDTYNATSGNGTLTVTKGDTTVIVLSDAGTQFSGGPGQKITLKGKLLRTSDKGAIVGRTLVFKVDGNVVGTAVTGSTGSARLSYAVPEIGYGDHQLTVEFDGDAEYNSCIGFGILTVNEVDTYITVTTVSGVPGQKVTLKGYLLRVTDKAGVAGRTVIFYVDGYQVGTAVTSTFGGAQISYVIPLDMDQGDHMLTLFFPGDDSYSGTNTIGTLTVN